MLLAGNPSEIFMTFRALVEKPIEMVELIAEVHRGLVETFMKVFMRKGRQGDIGKPKKNMCIL